MANMQHIQEPDEYRGFFYYAVKTPFGKAWVLCQSDGHIRLTSSGPTGADSNFLKINNVEYTVHVDLFDYGNGFELKRQDANKSHTTWYAVYSSRKGSCGSDKLTDSARNKVVEWVVPFMREWQAEHPYEIALGKEAGTSNDLMRACEDVKKATAELDEAQTRATIAEATYQADRIIRQTTRLSFPECVGVE